MKVKKTLKEELEKVNGGVDIPGFPEPVRGDYGNGEARKYQLRISSSIGIGSGGGGGGAGSGGGSDVVIKPEHNM